MHSHTRKDFSFDKRANKYDNGYEGKISKRFYRNLISAVKLENGFKVLDVGCGTGTILQRLSEQADIDGYGVDASESMLKEAKQKCPEMTFQIGDCSDLPFEDNSFDVVVSCMAYHHFSSQDGFRKEAYRILKPNGMLYVCDPKFPSIIKKAINGVFIIVNTNASFYKPEELKRDFSQAGFNEVNIIKDGYVQVLTAEKN